MVLPSDAQQICSKLSLAAGVTACLNVLGTLINSLGIVCFFSHDFFLKILQCRLDIYQKKPFRYIPKKRGFPN